LRKTSKKKTKKLSKSSQKNLVNSDYDKNSVNSNYSQLAKQLKTLRDTSNSNFENTTNTRKNLIFVKSTSNPHLNSNYNSKGSKYFETQIDFKSQNSNSNQTHKEKNSMTVLSKTTKENSVLVNSASPKKIIRSSFHMNFNCNDIEGPEELHFFNVITSLNNKRFALKFDKNPENFLDYVSDEFWKNEVLL
jgi:hypothetical protein